MPTVKPQQEEKTLTTAQAAAVLGCSPGHVRTLITQGKLPSVPERVMEGDLGTVRYIHRIPEEKVLEYNKLNLPNGVRGPRGPRKKKQPPKPKQEQQE